MINAKSYEELETIAKGDKTLEQSVEYVKRYLNGPLNHTIEDYIAEKELEATERGEKIGEKRGEKIGEKRGEKIGMKKGILETAKNLLSLNIDIKDISKVTGLSEKDLVNMQKNL